MLEPLDQKLYEQVLSQLWHDPTYFEFSRWKIKVEISKSKIATEGMDVFNEYILFNLEKMHFAI